MSDPANAPKRTDWQLFRALLPYARPHAWLYAIAVLCAPVSASLVVAQPWLLKQVIDEHIIPGDLDGLQRTALMFLVVVVAGFIAEALYTLTLSYAAMQTITGLRKDVYAHSLKMARSYHDRVPTGRLLTRATSDIEALGETLTAGAVTILLDVMLVVGVLVAMFTLDAKLTGALLFMAPPLAIIIEVIRRIMRKLFLRVRTSLAELNAFLAERLNGIRVVQLHSDEDRTLAAFDERLSTFRNATIQTNVWDAMLFAIVDGLSSVSVAMLLWYASGGALDDIVTAGLLAAFIEYISKLFQPIREFSQKVAVIQRAFSALEKIYGLLDHKELIASGDTTLEGHTGALTLTNVSFAYGDGPDVLHNINLVVQPGEVVALVGRTGSGKSTIGKLLTRAYQGYRGSICLGEHELTDLNLGDIRTTVGTVLQDVQLFPGEVRFNLALGADLSDEALQTAIDQVHATEAVERLGGLGGRIENGGRNLSVGEGQLLAFARTMAHDAPIVILDEATASVDTLTEARIQQATQAILDRKTVLVVAHRLSTVMTADRIAVLDQGRIVEIGSHQSLLAKNGAYADLFHTQFEHGSPQKAKH